jgi:hypothetical protein
VYLANATSKEQVKPECPCSLARLYTAGSPIFIVWYWNTLNTKWKFQIESRTNSLHKFRRLRINYKTTNLQRDLQHIYRISIQRSTLVTSCSCVVHNIVFSIFIYCLQFLSTIYNTLVLLNTVQSTVQNAFTSVQYAVGWLFVVAVLLFL